MTALDTPPISEVSDFPLKTSRYKPISLLGRGSWGKVYLALDEVTGTKVAIKVLDPNELAQQQMQYRGLSPSEVIRKEAGFKASRHVVPREIGVDDNGRYFIIQPPFPGTLDIALEERKKRGQRNSINLGYPNKERGFRWMRDIATGLDELHKIYGRVHGDWKPDNIMVDERDSLVINDLGTSTCISIGSRQNNRDNMGNLQTRARWLFNEGAHPDKESDLYGCSALLFRLHTGEYPFEKFYEPALEKVDNPLEAQRRVKNLLERTSSSELEYIKDKRIKDLVPKEFRSFYKEGLSVNPNWGFRDSELLRKGLERAILASNPENLLRTHMLKYGAGVGIVTFIAGVLAVGGVVRDWTMSNVPARPNLSGPLFLTDKPGSPRYEFDAEHIEDLPEIPGGMMIDNKEIERVAREATNDRTTAYLLAQYGRTILTGGSYFRNYVNEIQQKTWLAYTHPDARGMMSMPYREQRIVAKNIEVAFHKAKTPEDKIDLEDVCAISLCGEDAVNLAKRAANSQNFKEYVNATDSKGKRIISGNDEQFLKMWISYIHDRPPALKR